jgi:ribonuclease J
MNDKNDLIFMPIGGCNFIGTNLYLYRYKNTSIVIDCGIGFPDKRHTPGVDVLIADLSILDKYQIKLDALIITHAHEDHIGAVCHLYNKLKCPIYLSTFAKNFLEVDAIEFGLQGKMKLKEIKQNQKQFKIGDFDIEMIYLTHSTVESHGIFIKTDKACVFHTGDWKIDPNPVVGQNIDIERLIEIGKNHQVSALICDSTNCLKEQPRHGPSSSEGDLEGNIYDLVKKQNGLVVVTTFASNVARIQTVANVAKKSDRVLVLSGHSMHRIVAIAQKSGYLNNIETVDARDAAKMPKNKVLLLATGCQGEENATIAKLAKNKHPFFKLEQSDCVLFSSKTIPGNEIEVSEVVNSLIEKNIEIFTEEDYFLHVSGHPYRNDLREMYSWIKPNALIPMHGNWLMLKEHTKFAQNCGIKKVLMPKNGTLIKITEDNVEIVSQIQTNSLCIDGKRTIIEKSKIFKERNKLSSSGIISCNVVLNNKGGVVIQPEITSLGLLDINDKHDFIFLKNLEKKISQALISKDDQKRSLFKKKKVMDKKELEEKVYSVIKKDVHFYCGKFPFISISLNII